METIVLHELEFQKIIPEAIILESIQKLGNTIRKEYYNLNPIVLVVLNGAFIFGAELIKHLDFPMELDFVRYRSYKGLESGGEIIKSMALPSNLSQRHILLVEDIVDTGLTLSALKKDIELQKPASLKIATLIFKPLALKYSEKPDFSAIETSNPFIVGFGLDYKHLGRNLRSIYQLKD